MLAQEPPFRGDSQHSGVYEARRPKFTGVKWQFHTKGQVVVVPAIGRDSLYFGSSDHWLYALYLATGAQKWKFKTKATFASSPCGFGRHRLFRSYDAFLRCGRPLRQLKWKFQTGRAPLRRKHLHGGGACFGDDA